MATNDKCTTTTTKISTENNRVIYVNYDNNRINVHCSSNMTYRILNVYSRNSQKDFLHLKNRPKKLILTKLKTDFTIK